jgi:SAM-dependent methyltransferase
MVHDAALEAAFGDAAADHYAWQTRSPGVAENERELCERAFLPLNGRVLDLGCGEGATLYHLGAPAGAVGVDLFPRKIAFAQAMLPQCRFVAASVYELPFENAAFDQLIVRDLIHHLEDPGRFIDECARVLAPGGRIDILEPCRYNPLIVLHALLNEVERGELRSTPRYLGSLLSHRFHVDSVEPLQPLPLHRIVFHPHLGNPKLGAVSWINRSVMTLEQLASRVLPRSTWAYIHLRARSSN